MMMTDVMKTLRGSLPSATDVLHHVGLEKEHSSPSVLAAVATFAVGAATGAALAVLFTPRTSREIRQALRDQLRTWKERVSAPTHGDSADLAHSRARAKQAPEAVAMPG